MSEERLRKLIPVFLVSALVAGTFLGNFYATRGASRDAEKLGRQFSKEVDHFEVESWVLQVSQKRFSGGLDEVSIEPEEWPTSVRSFFGEGRITCTATLSSMGEVIGIYFRQGVLAIVISIRGLPYENYYSVSRIDDFEGVYAASIYK